MSKDTQISTTAVNAQADALARLLDNGYLRIYDGAKPATADTALGAQVLLAELRMNAVSAPAAINGILTFNAMTPESAAKATSTASWFRAFKSDGTSAVLDGTAGVSGSNSNLEMATTSIVQNARIGVSSFTHTVAKSTAGL